MKKGKPLGMRIGESVFCAGYLLFALYAGMVFLGRMTAIPDQADLWRSCAVMTLLLGCGDAFHLVPRILINIRGEAETPEQAEKQAWQLGLGNLVSSVTMTLFYIVFYYAVSYRAGIAVHRTMVNVLCLLAGIRILLCLFPQNGWFRRTGSVKWGVIRNIPFVIMGVITVFFLLRTSVLMALLVTVSFVCYMLVVLYAAKKPVMGMLMIPKTICYIWIIALFL